MVRIAADTKRLAFILWQVMYCVLPIILSKMIGRPMAGPVVATRLRRSLEELGVGFVKIGQYLAIRHDLLPSYVCKELSTLYNAASELPFASVLKVLEDELGHPIDHFFTHIDERAIAAASIAQVHRGVARDGTVLALKIQRPGALEILRSDLRNLRRLAVVVDRFGLLHAISAAALVDEIALFTLQEFDFEAEARSAERLKNDGLPGIQVPDIRWDLTRKRILAMEFVEGISLLAICQRAEAGDHDPFASLLPGCDPKSLVTAFVNACFVQIFVIGRFHGDPHPANIMVRRDGVIVFIDFGIVGELDSSLRKLFRIYVEYIARGELAKASQVLTHLVSPGPDTDRRAYRLATIPFMRRWYVASNNPKAPAVDRLQAQYQGEMFRVMRRHGVRMPADQLLFWKALASLDATTHRLPVDVDLLSALGRFFRQEDPRARLVEFAAVARQLHMTDWAMRPNPQGLSAKRVRVTRDDDSGVGARDSRDRLGPIVLALIVVSIVVSFARSIH